MGDLILSRLQRVGDEGIPIERIAVAFGAKGRATVLAWVGNALDAQDEIGGEAEFYGDIDDLLEADRQGIWIWEGWPKPVGYHDYEYGHYEFEGWSFARGEWREATDEELTELQFGGNPWTEPCPDCAPCPHCKGTGSDCSGAVIEGCKHCEGDGRTKPPPLTPPEPEPPSIESMITGSTFTAIKEPPKCPRCKSRGVVRCDDPLGRNSKRAEEPGPEVGRVEAR